MDSRKLICFGKGSYVVSIPKKWVEKHKLRKGDILNLGEDYSGLTLSPNVAKEITERTITITAYEKSIDLIRAEIVTAYINGYDTIEIISKDLGEKEFEIKEILRNLAGIEIMEQTSTKTVAKSLINIREVSLHDLTRRMDIITRGMIDDTINCIDNPKAYDGIYSRDYDVNRLHFLVCRIVVSALKDPMTAKIINLSPSQLIIYKTIVDKIEKIADRQKRIARHLAKAEFMSSTKEELKAILINLRERYARVMKAYYTLDKSTSYLLSIESKEAIKACGELLMHNSGCAIYKKKKGVPLSSNNCVMLASIVENLQAMATSIKLIARSVLEET